VVELSLRRGYQVLVGSRIRSQLAYRTSFVLLTLTSAAVGVVELTELYVILHNVPVFGGLNLAQAGVVFALANMGFSLAASCSASLMRFRLCCERGSWRRCWSVRCR
jgi:ABC-type uncharacterized transport system permease subunit